MGEFEVLPRLRIRGGRAVHEDGSLDGRQTTVAGVNRLLTDHGRVLLWDLDGIERNRPRFDFVRQFEGDPVWVDAGVRTAEAVIDVLVAGAERAVLGTKTLSGFDELDEARALSDDIAVQVDAGADERRSHAWSARSVIEWSSRANLEACLVVRERDLPDVDVVPRRVGIYVGIAAPRDFDAMRSKGYRGAITEGTEETAWTS